MLARGPLKPAFSLYCCSMYRVLTLRSSSNHSVLHHRGSSTPKRPPSDYHLPRVSQPTKPPLVTLRSALYPLYGTAALATSIYSMSEYIVTPMRKHLNGARHELAEAAQENLHRLNEKLEQNVSTIPSLHESGDQGGPKAADAVEDSDSV